MWRVSEESWVMLLQAERAYWRPRGLPVPRLTLLLAAEGAHKNRTLQRGTRRDATFNLHPAITSPCSEPGRTRPKLAL